VCAGGGTGREVHLHLVENVFEDVFAGEGGLPMYPGWIGAWGVTLEKMSRREVHCVGAQAGGMCVYKGMGGKGKRDPQWGKRESWRAKETGMDVWDRMLREFEGRRRGVQGAVGGDTPEVENKTAGERERLHAGMKYTPGSAEKRGGGLGDHNPVSLSLSPTLLEVKEEVGDDEGVGEGGSDCDDLSWLVGLGNVWCVLRFTDKYTYRYMHGHKLIYSL